MSDVDDSHTFAMQDIPNQRPPVLKKKKKSWYTVNVGTLMRDIKERKIGKIDDDSRLWNAQMS